MLKTEGALQQAARTWAQRAWWPLVLGLAAVSLATPVVSATVRARWFAMPGFIALLPIPLATATALLGLRWLLRQPQVLGRWCALPMAAVVAVFLLGGLGLAYSLYPYVVMDRLTVWQAASSTEALAVIAVGCCFAVPAIVGYSIFAYRVFGGKAQPLSYA